MLYRLWYSQDKLLQKQTKATTTTLTIQTDHPNVTIDGH